MKAACRLLIAIVLGLALVIGIASCRSICEYLGIAVGAGGAAVVSGGNPLATAGGGVTGKELGSRMADALGADKELTQDEWRKIVLDARRTIVELQSRKPLEVPVDRPFIPWWGWAIAIYVAVQWLARLVSPRARTQILKALGDLLHGRIPAALARYGAAEGVVHTDTAARMSERAAVRRRERLERAGRKGGGGAESAPGNPAGSRES